MQKIIKYLIVFLIGMLFDDQLRLGFHSLITILLIIQVINWMIEEFNEL